MGTKQGRTRRLAGVLAVLATAAILTSCDVSAVGKRCKGGFARDSSHVLSCRNGRWARLMTFREYLLLIERNQAGGADSLDGNLEVLSGDLYSIHISGWVRDHDTDRPVVVRVSDTVPFQFGVPPVIADIGAEVSRPDAPGGRGFDLRLSRLAGFHYICVTAMNVPGTRGSDIELGCKTVEVQSDAPADPLPATAGWLETLNYHRTASGLVPMVDDPARYDAIRKHLIYLRDTPDEYFTGPYTNLHTENPASPYYTPEGAGYSHNVLTWASTERSAIEGWIDAPFHAINLLNPRYNTASFALLDGIAAALTFGTAPLPDPITGPVTVPGNGTITSLRSFYGENPDPRDPCPNPSSWHGLPLIVLFPTDPPAGISASLRLPNGDHVPPTDLCVVSERNYVSSDPTYGPAGTSILNGANAVLVIPRDPLTPGTHTVHLDVPGSAPVDWSFAVSR